MTPRLRVARFLLAVSGRLIGEAPPPVVPHRRMFVYVVALTMLALWVLLDAIFAMPGPHTLARLL